MILEQFLQVDIHQGRRKYYQDKGYILDIPSYSVKGNHNTTYFYTAIIDINDLSSNAGYTVTRICDDCGKIDIVKWNKHQFEKCYDCGHKREIHYQHCTECGKDLRHWNKDVKLCRECWREQNKGETHPSYGKSWHDLRTNKENTHKYKIRKWRTQVKERDNYICQICGHINKNVIAHHLYDRCNFPDKIYDLDNGVTLCKSCHSKFHSSYGHYGKPVTLNEFKQFKEDYQNEHS